MSIFEKSQLARVAHQWRSVRCLDIDDVTAVIKRLLLLIAVVSFIIVSLGLIVIIVTMTTVRCLGGRVTRLKFYAHMNDKLISSHYLDDIFYKCAMFPWRRSLLVLGDSFTDVIGTMNAVSIRTTWMGDHRGRPYTPRTWIRSLVWTFEL